MKLVSWNVNGLRAVHRKGAWDDFLKTVDADVICLQETKAHPEQLPDEVREIPGFKSYFSYSKVKKGYSGTAIYTKEEPKKVEFGMGIERFDDEGRIVAAFYEDMALFNIYFPNGGGGPERLEYKLDFYDAFLDHINAVKKDGFSIIFGGDVNTAHEAIDLARPKENEKNTGFLPEEREWLDEVVRHGYVDTFRHKYPAKPDAYSYWDMKTRARERNVGWRIDYFFASSDLVPNIKKVDILSHIMGSDHCPILLEL